MTSPPLVSILIRTLGRPTLPRSIAAACAQTHRPIEIVVVNAGAAPLPSLPATPDVALRVVGGTPLRRPQAANVGLESARGDWLVFLDDDDLFAPTHVASLLKAAAQAPGARVAYSATACVDPAGTPSLVIGAPFNRLQLFHGNYIQMGAALFAASLVTEGVRFDEAFDCYEDWDFLIQLAQRTHFVYTGLPTNLWNAYTGESGAGLGPNKRDDATEPYKRQVLEKWAAQAADLGDKVKHHELAARQAAARREPRYEDRHRAEVARLVKGTPGSGMSQGN